MIRSDSENYQVVLDQQKRWEAPATRGVTRGAQFPRHRITARGTEKSQHCHDFNTVHLLPKDLRFEHGGTISPRYAPACNVTNLRRRYFSMLSNGNLQTLHARFLQTVLLLHFCNCGQWQILTKQHKAGRSCSVLSLLGILSQDWNFSPF